jgi:hypothetical protein
MNSESVIVSALALACSPPLIEEILLQAQYDRLETD